MAFSRPDRLENVFLRCARAKTDCFVHCALFSGSYTLENPATVVFSFRRKIFASSQRKIKINAFKTNSMNALSGGLPGDLTLLPFLIFPSSGYVH